MSSINPNNINTAYPVPGEDQDSQGFRDNFTAIANNFSQAATEITDLQTKVLLKQALNGTVLNNDMNGAVIKSATMTDMRLPVFPINTVSSSTIVLDSTNGVYQYVSLAGQAYTLKPEFSTVKNTMTTVFLEISASANATLQFQSSASGISYEGLDAIPRLGSTPNGDTLYVGNTSPSTQAGNAIVLAFTMRSTTDNNPDQGVITVQDISQLQSRVRSGNSTQTPYKNPDTGFYTGQPGDRAGDLLVTAGNSIAVPPIFSKIWLCVKDFDINSSNANVSIWSSVVASEVDLTPQGPDGAVQFKVSANGTFGGNTTLVLHNPPSYTVSGNLTVGDASGNNYRIDSSFYGDINLIRLNSGRGGNINANATSNSWVYTYNLSAAQIFANTGIYGSLNQANTSNSVYASQFGAQSATVAGLTQTGNLVSNTGVTAATVTSNTSVSSPAFIVNSGPANGYNLAPSNVPGTGAGPWALTSSAANVISFANVAVPASNTGGEGAVQYNSNTQFTSSNNFVYYSGNSNLVIGGPAGNGTVRAATFIGDVIGNISGNLVVMGANSGIVFKDLGNAEAAANFTFDKGNSNVALTGNLNANGNISANYFLGNITNAIGFYSNSNVASYLPNYPGNLGGTITNSQPYLSVIGDNNLANGRTFITVNTDSITIGSSGVANVITLSSNGISVTNTNPTTANITAAGTIQAPSLLGTLTGNVVGNITVTALANLGSVGNVKIYGGSDGLFLATDGNGNLSWAVGGGGGANGNGVPSGGNGFVQFYTESNGNVAFGSTTKFVYSTTSDTLNVGNGTVGVGNITAYGLLKQYGTILPAGTANTIQLTDGLGNFTSNPSLSFSSNTSSNTLSVAGNIIARNFLGNIVGNVIGVVSNASFAINAGDTANSFLSNTGLAGIINVTNPLGSNDASLAVYNQLSNSASLINAFAPGGNSENNVLSMGYWGSSPSGTPGTLYGASTSFIQAAGASNLVIGSDSSIIFATGPDTTDTVMTINAADGALEFPSLANLRIPGGGSGNVLTTYGNGVLNWANANVGVAAYLPSYPGNLVSLTGNVTTTANLNGLGITTTGAINIATFLGVGGADVGNAVTGEIRATNNITAYYSDERLKTRLGAIENALDKVDQLNGFYHEASDLAVSLGYQRVREVGVSAQEVQAVLPEIVAPAPIDEQYLTVRYERLTPLLIEAIKELRREVNDIKQQLKGQ